MTHTLKRTMEYLRKQGYVVEKTETWNQWARKRRDLFGMLDAVGLRYGEIVGVQACSGSDFEEHRKKLENAEHLKLWLSSAKLVLVGWRKVVTRNKDGKKSKVKRWKPRVLWF